MVTHLFLEDLGMPLDRPVPVGEDNASLRTVAHSGKITRNVRHVALKTRFVQNLVRFLCLRLREIGSAKNRADHFTKTLPGPAFREHTQCLMGLRFITFKHIDAFVARKKAKEKHQQLTNESSLHNDVPT